MIAVPAGTTLIIIDLDNTLAIMPIEWSGMRQALAATFPDVSFSRISAGVSEVLHRYGSGGREKCFDVIRKFEKDSIPGIRPVQEVFDMLERYRGKTLFAICSNNMHATIDDAVEALGLTGVFSALVGRDDVVESKPAPEGLLRILRELRVPAEETVFVGNQESDEQAGASAAIETIIIAADGRPISRAAMDEATLF